MDITRELAITILRYLERHKDFRFPFLVVCKEYTEEDDYFVEIEPEEWESIAEDDTYQTFQLWENLQNLDGLTLKLMAKGFLEIISKSSLESHIRWLIEEYKMYNKEEMWLNHKTSNYGDSEFFKGKLEAYIDCLKLIKKIRN